MEERRTQTLVKPRLQLRAILVGALVTLSVLIVQGVTMVYSFNRAATKLPTEGVLILDELPRLLFWNLVLCSVFLVPLLLGVGLTATHRIAGPVFRMERHLRAVLRGERPGTLSLREGDELQELAGLVDQVCERAVGAKAPRRATATEVAGSAETVTAATIEADVDDVASLVPDPDEVPSEDPTRS